MGVSTAIAGASRVHSGGNSWLRHQKWDLSFVSLSVVLVPMPYLLYLAVRNWGALSPLARSFNSTNEDISRQIVNTVVGIAIGGPHMYATFARTTMDRAFVDRFRAFTWSTLAIPAIVISLAFINISILVSVFFFWASLHVLHQIVFIVECYNVKDKAKSTLSFRSRATDYAVVLTSLYPIAVYRMYKGTFEIGPFNVGESVGSFLSNVVPGVDGFPLVLVFMAGTAFGLSFVAFTLKSITEIRRGYAHTPKILFIYVTVIATFWTPALKNLDTAFQGLNVWHSFQYVALTWYINKLRQERGELKPIRLAERLRKDDSMRGFYLFNVGLTLADAALAGIVFLILKSTGMNGTDAFERAYYVAVLSFLWMHYYHDHFLFTQPQAIDFADST